MKSPEKTLYSFFPKNVTLQLSKTGVTMFIWQIRPGTNFATSKKPN
jgi:hypothetical protein